MMHCNRITQLQNYCKQIHTIRDRVSGSVTGRGMYSWHVFVMFTRCPISLIGKSDNVIEMYKCVCACMYVMKSDGR